MQISTSPQPSKSSSETFASSREEEEKDAKIAALGARVKALQAQIAERVRGFLLHSKSKSKRTENPAERKSAAIQTEAQFASRLLQQTSSRNCYNLQETPQRSENANYSDSKNEAETVGVETDSERLNSKQYKLFGQLPTQHNGKEGHAVEVREFESPSEKGGLDREAFYLRQRKKLRKQIKALREKIAFQSEVAQYAKEALLQSEQENYQFRLQLRSAKEEMTKLRQNYQGIDPLLSNGGQSTRQLQQSNLLKQLSVLKERESLLTAEVEQKTRQTSSLLLALGYKTEDYPKQLQDITNDIEKLKEIVYEISNYVPIKASCCDSVFFSPSSISEMVISLARVRDYCHSIGQWENDQHVRLAVERKRVVEVLQAVASSLDQFGRETVACCLKRDPSWLPYLPLFRKPEDLPKTQSADPLIQ